MHNIIINLVFLIYKPNVLIIYLSIYRIIYIRAIYISTYNLLFELINYFVISILQ